MDRFKGQPFESALFRLDFSAKGSVYGVMKQTPKYCAIYTRKSTDEGLDTDFNTLDAQREACEAYIASQRSEGWQGIDTHYDDGGFSGGNMDRPGLQKLLDDVKAGKVNIIVVYKIDRLTRSLIDFAKLVDVFDEHDVTFVSVTQSFNTTTSMGRLTLNVLLSFAQFEREVSAERIRDKIAASKKKGMWMGGNPPIGYQAINKKLIINKKEAKQAQHIFERYLTLGSVAALKKELDKDGIFSKQRVSKRGNKHGGKSYSRGALYSILQNPIYIGNIRHKDRTYDGQHDAIIAEDLWNEVQKKLNKQSATVRGKRKDRSINLLKGVLYDSENNIYSPTYTKNGRQHYRYYINQNLLQYRDRPKGIMARIPAQEIEDTITIAMRNNLIDVLDLDQIEHHSLIQMINDQQISYEILISHSVNKVIIDKSTLFIHIDLLSVRKTLENQLHMNIPGSSKNNSHILEIPFSIKRAHKGTIIIKPETNDDDPFDLPPEQLNNLIRGIVWRDEHFGGMSMKAIADRERLSKAGVRKIIMGSFQTLMNA